MGMKKKNMLRRRIKKKNTATTTTTISMVEKMDVMITVTDMKV